MKNILFVTYKMGAGGVEKALINVLQLLDKSQYKAEVMVIQDGGEFIDYLPKDIKLLKYNCPNYISKVTNYAKRVTKEDCPNIKRYIWNLLLFMNRVSIKLFKKAFIFRIFDLKYRKNNPLDKYDMIIDFHGYGNYTSYLVAMAKVDAIKVSWIHEQTIYPAYRRIGGIYKRFDKIFGNCLDSCDNFISVFPKCREKVEVYYNYLDINEIITKANEKVPKELEIDKTKIISVGRVTEQKDFMKAIETAEILKKRDIEFKWVVVGNGDQYEELYDVVQVKQLNDVMEFVGFRNNPYVYIKNADLYVQTSRAEGYCTTISEAIILGKPVVSTEVGGVNEQLDNGKGGIITKHNPIDIANAIIHLINHKTDMEKIINHNKGKNMRFEKELEKLYRLF